MTPAEELRTAAAKIHEAARKAMPGPWQVDGPYWHNDTYGRGLDTGMVSSGALRREVAVATPMRRETEQNMAHIAMWHPGVAGVVAQWLETTADENEKLTALAEAAFVPEAARHILVAGPFGTEFALAIARAINGGSEASATQPMPAEDCGCRPNPNGLHLKTCPVWVNIGPSLAQRHYVRRDTKPGEWCTCTVDIRFAPPKIVDREAGCAFHGGQPLPTKAEADQYLPKFGKPHPTAQTLGVACPSCNGLAPEHRRGCPDRTLDTPPVYDEHGNPLERA